VCGRTIDRPLPGARSWVLGKVHDAPSTDAWRQWCAERAASTAASHSPQVSTARVQYSCMSTPHTRHGGHADSGLDLAYTTNRVLVPPSRSAHRRQKLRRRLLHAHAAASVRRRTMCARGVRPRGSRRHVLRPPPHAARCRRAHAYGTARTPLACLRRVAAISRTPRGSARGGRRHLVQSADCVLRSQLLCKRPLARLAVHAPRCG